MAKQQEIKLQIVGEREISEQLEWLLLEAFREEAEYQGLDVDNTYFGDWSLSAMAEERA